MFNYKRILKDDDILATTILNEMYPGEKFSDPEREAKSIKDIKWTLQFISEGLIVENRKIVENLLLWFKKLFIGLNIDESNVELLFEKTKKVLHDFYNNDEIDSFLVGIKLNELKEQNLLIENNPYLFEMESYLKALLNSDRLEAQKIIHKMIEEDVPVGSIYLYVFQETMRRVGTLWHEGKIQVGREHYCTAVTQYLMSSLYSRIFSREPKNRKLLACAVGSELHEMGIRMVADLFEMEGWDTSYLGANLPSREIIDFAKDFKPDVIALSITMPYHISTLKDTIKEIKEDKELENIKIIVGGLPFIDNDQLYIKVGADAYAANAIEGIKIANSLLQ